MKIRISLLLLLLLVILAVPSFSTNLDIRYKTIDSSAFPLVVTTFEVMDEDGAYVRNLSNNQIHVGENMEVIQNIRVESAPEETNILMVLDNSGSMKKYYREMKQNFFAIIQQLGERDRCGVLQLQGQPRVLQCLCRDKFASLEKMRMIKREGSAEIFRGIEKAYEMLIKKPGAKEIILMTDAPVCGERKLRKSQQKIVDTIVRRCRVSGVRLHVIGFGQGIDDDALLSQLVSETGGRFMVHPTPYELNYEFKRVLYSTPAEYRVAWISPQRLPRHQKYCMQVKVNAEEGSGAKKIKFTP